MDQEVMARKVAAMTLGLRRPGAAGVTDGRIVLVGDSTGGGHVYPLTEPGE